MGANEHLSEMQKEIDAIEADAAAKLATIEARIAQITAMVEGELLLLLMGMKAAEHEIEDFIHENEDHLDEMQNNISNGIGASGNAKDEETMMQSPAGRHLKDSQDALSDWLNSDLHDQVTSAGEGAIGAAEHAK